MWKGGVVCVEGLCDVCGRMVFFVWKGGLVNGRVVRCVEGWCGVWKGGVVGVWKGGVVYVEGWCGVWKGGAVYGRAVWWGCGRVVWCVWKDGVMCVEGWCDVCGWMVMCV